jgi:hypothetical protein
MGQGEEVSHISSRSSDPNSRRMMRGPEEQTNNNGETISIAGLVGMNLSASISSKNKYRTNSQNNTAARTFAGHFEGLHGTMQPGTKLPNLDQRHQPKDASEIVLQNKLHTPAPSSAKFGQSKYASPIRSSA